MPVTVSARAKPRARPETSTAAGQLEIQIERLKSRLRLAVIYAGDKTSPESVIYRSGNTRSWKSYEGVACDIAQTLRNEGFKHVELLPEDMLLADRLRRDQIHMAWLNTGGVQGYNSAGHAASLLEMLGVPYVGHNPLAATTLDNKHAFKREAVCADLPTAAFTTWDMSRGPFVPELNSRFLHAFGNYAGPFIVKPVSGRASLNVVFVEHLTELPQAIAEVHRATNNLVLIEEYLPGREFCVAVAGPVISVDGRIVVGRKPFAFGVLERNFSHDEKIFTSMDVRPINSERFKHLDARKEPELHAELLRLARDVYLEFGLETLIRLDVRSDETGRLYILEANPKPDLKSPSAETTSLIAAGLEQTTLRYSDLLMSLFADRVQFLLSHRAEAVRHIQELLSDVGCPAVDLQMDHMVLTLRDIAAQMRSA